MNGYVAEVMPDEKHCNKQYEMDWIDHKRRGRKKKQQPKTELFMSCISRYETWNYSQCACTVLHMQNKGNEITWSGKALACHFHFNSLYPWLI